MAVKLNGSAKWIGAMIAAVIATFTITYTVRSNDVDQVEVRCGAIEKTQAVDHTEIQLLKQMVNRTDENVSDIHKVIFIPKL